MAIWLNTLLFKNSRGRITEAKTFKRLDKYIRSNCENIIRSKTQELRQKISNHCVEQGDPSVEFLNRWNNLEKLSWADEIIKALDETIKVFEETPGIVVTKRYEKLLDEKEKEVLKGFKTRFSEDSLKKIKENSEKNMFDIEHVEIFIRYAMIPYFSSRTDNSELKQYLKWLRNPDNLLRVSNAKAAAPRYSKDQVDDIKNSVDDYIDANGFSFQEKDFYRMMKTLFCHLIALSDPAELRMREETEQRILKTVKETYWRRIFPNEEFDVFAETLGISKDALDILIDDAADDTLTAYRTYCDQFKEGEKPSWDECISYGGFYVETMHFLSSRLWQQDSLYLQGVARDIRDSGWQYNTFIHQEAIIAPTVFIKENCIIEKAEIQDYVRLSNCTICDDVIIEKGSIIDPARIVIEQGMCVKSGTTIEGTIVYTESGAIIQI